MVDTVSMDQCQAPQSMHSISTRRLGWGLHMRLLWSDSKAFHLDEEVGVGQLMDGYTGAGRPCLALEILVVHRVHVWIIRERCSVIIMFMSG